MMRRDTDDGQLDLCNATPPRARGLRGPGQRCGRTSPATLIVSVIGLASLSTVACEDKDTTLIVPADGGTGGGGGRAGSNAGGRAGSSMAGGAGEGGAAGGGGMSGGAGVGGNAGGPGDAGTDAAVTDGGDAGGPVGPTREEICAAVCAKMDQVVGCEPNPTCAADLCNEMAGYDGIDNSCVATTNAYFECQANDSVDSFACNGLDPNVPLFVYGTNNCDAEEAAWEVAFCGTCPCP